jgi:hypothetical protein
LVVTAPVRAHDRMTLSGRLTARPFVWAGEMPGSPAMVEELTCPVKPPPVAPGTLTRGRI